MKWFLGICIQIKEMWLCVSINVIPPAAMLKDNNPTFYSMPIYSTFLKPRLLYNS